MLLKKMHAVIAGLNKITAERAELIKYIFIALLTSKNLFVLGGTGQAKSFVINLVCKCIVGAKLFTRLLTKQTDEEQLFGRIDLKSYIEGNPRMMTTGKIPESHIAFLDEIWKSNEGILNSLLTATNERRYTNEGETVDIPTISFLSASNELRDFNDPDEEILRPLFDRFHLKVVTQDIESRDERLRILSQKQRQAEVQIATTITLDELRAMQEEVAAVAVPEKINELMDDILCELRRRGIQVSDRKFLNYYPIAQAQAWLNGRNTVEAADLIVLKCYLWTEVEEIATIEKVLERFCINPLEGRLKEIAQLAIESNNEFKANVGAKPNKALMKLRSEFLRLYSMLMPANADELDTEGKAAVTKAIDSLEKMSQAAHKKCSYTYAPLPELMALHGGQT